jgi:DNA modification methylase
MRDLGWRECDIVEVAVDDLAATSLGIALNRSAELASWDEPVLARLLRELQNAGAIEGVGFADSEIDELLAGLEDLDTAELADPGPESLPEKPVTREGDLWQLGDHRLLCGDSRDGMRYTRLLQGEVVDLVWSDPPFGVSYLGKTSDALTIENDDLDLADLHALLNASFRAACNACRPGAVWYIAAPAGPNFLPFAQVLTDLGIWRQTLVWLKDTHVLGRSDYHYRHEALLYGWTPGAAHHAPPARDLDSVWEIPRPRASPDHPTTKPLELVTRALLASSKPKAIVLDMFVGSGTTVLAAESTGRAARAIEVDPRYVDVAVNRWQLATSRSATLDNDGRTFTEIAAERSQPEGAAA